MVCIVRRLRTRVIGYPIHVIVRTILILLLLAVGLPSPVEMSKIADVGPFGSGRLSSGFATSATFFGGSLFDSAHAVARDATGNVVVLGLTSSSDLPVTTSVVQQQLSEEPGEDLFVAKFDPEGRQLLACTYFGGLGTEDPVAIATGVDGSIYIAGHTTSQYFPTQNALQASPVQGREVFVSRLTSDLSDVVFSTYLGGNGTDMSYGLAVSQSGDAIVVGSTNSPDFPLKNPLQPSCDCLSSEDGFVSRISASGQQLVFSTYLGGGNELGPTPDVARAVVVGGSGEIVIVGSTTTNNFPVVNALQPTLGDAPGTRQGDGFVCKLDSTGSRILFSTYLGGYAEDVAQGLDIDAAGNIYVAGWTYSSNFPTTAGAFQTEYEFGHEAFVAKLTPQGSSLVYSTLLVGQLYENAFDIGVDSRGHAYVVGRTSSPDFPVVSADRFIYSGIVDGFISKLNPTGSALVYSTFLGGLDEDSASSIDIDSADRVVVVGATQSADFRPLVMPRQASLSGQRDAFIVQLFDPDRNPAEISIDGPAAGAVVPTIEPIRFRFTVDDADGVAGIVVSYLLYQDENFHDIARLEPNAREVLWRPPDHLAASAVVRVAVIDVFGNVASRLSNEFSFFQGVPVLTWIMGTEVTVAGPPDGAGAPAIMGLAALEIPFEDLPYGHSDVSPEPVPLSGLNLYRIAQPPEGTPLPDPETIAQPQNIVASVATGDNSIEDFVRDGRGDNFVYVVTRMSNSGVESAPSAAVSTNLPVIVNPVFRRGALFLDRVGSRLPDSGARLEVSGTERFELKLEPSGLSFRVPKTATSQPGGKLIKQVIRRNRNVALRILTSDGRRSMPVIFRR